MRYYIFQLFQDRSVSEEEQRDMYRKECQQLRLRIAELEGARNGLERDLYSARAVMTGEEETAKQRVATLTEVRKQF